MTSLKSGRAQTAPSATVSQPLVSLKTYISNAFFGVFIQEDDEIALEVYRKNWSPDVEEVNNGQPLNFEGFRTLLVNTRASLNDRYLTSQSAVVAPADAEGKSGQVAHTSHWTATSNGKKIKGTIVSVLKIESIDGRRQIKTESFVLSTEDA